MDVEGAFVSCFCRDLQTEEAGQHFQDGESVEQGSELNGRRPPSSFCARSATKVYAFIVSLLLARLIVKICAVCFAPRTGGKRFGVLTQCSARCSAYGPGGPPRGRRYRRKGGPVLPGSGHSGIDLAPLIFRHLSHWMGIGCIQACQHGVVKKVKVAPRAHTHTHTQMAATLTFLPTP